MKKLIALLVALPLLLAQTTQTFNNFIATLPAASSLGASDQLYVRQAGTSKQLPGSAIPGVSPGSIVGSQIASGTIANSNLANMTGGTMKCRPIGAITGTPQDCSARLINIVDQGADPTGIAAIDTAFTAAMAICANNTAAFPGGTVYIPPGNYVVSSGLVWKKGCNILADNSARIFTNTASITLLSGDTSGTSAQGNLAQSWLQGGTWDCNNKATTGFNIPYFSHYTHIHHFIMANCIAGGGSYIVLGSNNGSPLQDGMYIDNFWFFNSLGTTIAANSFGITTSNPGGPVTDSFFINGMIEDTTSAVSGSFYNAHFIGMHVWNFTACLNVGFHITGGNGDNSFTDDIVDGPVCTGTAAYSFDTVGSYRMANSNYNSLNSLSNTGTIGVFVGNSGGAVNLYSSGFSINTDATAVAADFSGTLTGLTALGTLYKGTVTTKAAGAWLTYTPSASCGTATFTVNAARFNTIAHTTHASLDVSVSAIGTCTNQGLNFNLPNTSQGGGGFVGRDIVSTGGNLVCSFGSSGTSAFCSISGTFTGTTRAVVSGSYENQ